MIIGDTLCRLGQSTVWWESPKLSLKSLWRRPSSCCNHFNLQVLFGIFAQLTQFIILSCYLASDPVSSDFINDCSSSFGIKSCCWFSTSCAANVHCFGFSKWVIQMLGPVSFHCYAYSPSCCYSYWFFFHRRKHGGIWLLRPFIIVQLVKTIEVSIWYAK